MIKIAHRGNINGPKPGLENAPGYLLDAITAGFDVEVDIWYLDGAFYLGHDEAIYQIQDDFLIKIGNYAWFHCKNLEALVEFNTVYPQLNYFWHQGDDYTLTSQGYIWTYPERELSHRSVIVDLSREPKAYGAYAICADYLV